MGRRRRLLLRLCRRGFPDRVGVMHLPIPSGLILSLVVFLVGQGRFSFIPVLLASTIGGVTASIVLYLPGLWIGEERLRQLIGRVERFKLVFRSDLDKASQMFERHGGKAIMIGHLVPRHNRLCLDTGGSQAHADLWTVHGLHRARHRPVERDAHRPGVGTGGPVGARGAVRADRRVRGASCHSRGDPLVPVVSVEGTQITESLLSS